MSTATPNGTVKTLSYWQTAAALGPVVAGFLALGWSFVNQSISAATEPSKRELAQLLIEVSALRIKNEEHEKALNVIVAQNQRSMDDRTELNAKVAQNYANISKLQADLSSELATRLANEREIETQFDADSQARNIQLADIDRTIAIIWNKSDGLGSYPGGPWYQPNISARKIK